jgi:hypothetical protein
MALYLRKEKSSHSAAAIIYFWIYNYINYIAYPSGSVHEKVNFPYCGLLCHDKQCGAKTRNTTT